MLSNKRIVAGLAATMAITSFGIAQASGGPNTSSGGTRPAVPATVVGMPPTAQVFFGVVNANGTKARGYGVTTVTHVASSPGAYIVATVHSVTSCAYQATVGLSGNSGVSPPGYANVTGASGDPTAVFVTTYNSTGQPADLGFHIVITC